MGLFEKQEKLHLIGWDKITKPKEKGGLGIQVAKPKNTAILVKLNWRFHFEKSSLWAKVLAQKYHNQRRVSRTQVNPISCSPTWTALKKGKDKFNKGSKWIASRDSELSLWFDKWLDKGMLRSLISGPLNKGEKNIRLKDVTSYFGWNMENVSFSFPTPILLEMKATPLPFSFQ